MIELEREQLLSLVQTDSELSDILMRAFILRRVEMIAWGFGDVVVLGSKHAAGTLRIREFLTRIGHPYTYVDLDTDKDAESLCEECVKINSRWVHLRTCQTCGKTLCCDRSPNRHASKHARTSEHPVTASAELGERWLYCYPDDSMVGY